MCMKCIFVPIMQCFIKYDINFFPTSDHALCKVPGNASASPTSSCTGLRTPLSNRHDEDAADSIPADLPPPPKKKKKQSRGCAEWGQVEMGEDEKHQQVCILFWLLSNSQLERVLFSVLRTFSDGLLLSNQDKTYTYWCC